MNKKVNIFLADDLHLAGINLLKKHFTIISLKGLDNGSLLKKAATYSSANMSTSVLVIRSVRNIGKTELNYIKSNTDISLICTVSAGFDNLDIQYARKLGIKCMNVAGANSTAAAEFTWAMLLSITKRLFRADAMMKSGEYDYNTFTNSELNGKTIGIIGVGNIGSKVAKIAMAFGMKILGNDINSSLKNKYLHIKFVSLTKLLSSSDIVTIHTPLDDSTKYLINRNNIKLMQKHSVLINCSRGGTVEETALIAALKKGNISYAGIDVFEREPAFNKTFAKLSNVILAPHLAGKTLESKERMARIAAEKIINFYKKSGNRAKLIN
ncbi:MAG: hypothetical protein HOP31_02830 [Ignavibacteria bacterium]|nr:hypothetical protein [Ignavibacteria bacterium]